MPWIIEGYAFGCVQSDVERDVEHDAATITAILETPRTSSRPMAMPRGRDGPMPTTLLGTVPAVSGPPLQTGR